MNGEMQLTFGPEVDKLSAALVAFQGEIGSVGKGSTAKVEKDGRLLYSYKYADLASVLEATREARAKAGLAVVQFPTGDAATGITLFTTVMHSSGQWMRGALTLRPMDTKPQTLGSLITYLRRYCYSAVLGIATEEDDDGAAAQGNGKGIAGGAAKANTVKATSTALMANASQIQQIHIAKEKIGGWTGKADHPGHPYRLALAAYKKADGGKAESSKDLTYEQASNLIKRMQGMIDRQAANAQNMEAQAPIAGAMNGDREPGSDDDDTGEVADAGLLQNVREAAVSVWGKKVKDLAPQWLQREFGVESAAALSKMQAERALQMLLGGNTL